MKKIIGSVVVLAVLVLGSYFGMGLLTQGAIEKSVGIINQSNGLLVEIDQYNRGLYTSKAILKWNIHVAERVSKNESGQIITTPAQDFKIQTPLTIYHGPIIFSNLGLKFGLGFAHSEVAIPENYAKQFSEIFTDNSIKPKLAISLFVNYLNKSQLHVNLPAFKLTFKDSGDQFIWNGMDTHVQFSSSFRHISGGFKIDGAVLLKDKMKTNLAQLVSNYDLDQTDSGLYLGQASITIPLLTVIDEDKQLLDIHDFWAQSSSDIDHGLFNSHFKLSLKKVVVNTKVYGPARLDMALTNLDAEVLAEVNSKTTTLQQGTDAERQQALLSILPELPKLFGKGAQFEISTLSVELPEGTLQGDLLITLPKGEAGNPFQMLQKLVGHAKLEVPAPVIKGLLTVTLRQKQQVQPQAALDPAVVDQMKNSGEANLPADQKTANTETTHTDKVVENKTLTPSEQEDQLSKDADVKLAALVQEGGLVLKGKNYLIELDLSQGQLTVNGKPYSSAMFQF